MGLRREKREPRRRVAGKIARMKVSKGVGRRGEDVVVAGFVLVVVVGVVGGEDWGAAEVPFRRVGVDGEAICLCVCVIY